MTLSRAVAFTLLGALLQFSILNSHARLADFVSTSRFLCAISISCVRFSILTSGLGFGRRISETETRFANRTQESKNGRKILEQNTRIKNRTKEFRFLST